MSEAWKRSRELAEQIRQAYRAGDVERARQLEAELDMVASIPDRPAPAIPAPPVWRRIAALWPLAALAGLVGATVVGLNRCSTSDAPRVPAEAVAACHDAIRERANHPSTVSFDTFGLATSVDEADGSYRVRQDFRAKNAFGLELRFVGICLFQPGGKTSSPDVLITESRG